MKRRITLSIALIAVLVSLTGSDSTTNAQRRIRRVVDTGLIMLGPNQDLRVTALNRGTAASTIRFRTIQYSQGTCGGGVCRHSAAAPPNISNLLTVGPGEAVSIDATSSSSGVRAVAAPDGVDWDNWTFLVSVVDRSTGEVVSLVQSGYDDEEMGMLN